MSGKSLGDLLNQELQKRSVWEKGTPIPGYDPAVWRRDRFGWTIKYSDYGLQSGYGWHNDHHVPSALGGSDSLFNRQPLHWRNNLAKSAKPI
jgi:hypothetical protein